MEDPTAKLSSLKNHGNHCYFIATLNSLMRYNRFISYLNCSTKFINDIRKHVRCFIEDLLSYNKNKDHIFITHDAEELAKRPDFLVQEYLMGIIPNISKRIELESVHNPDLNEKLEQLFKIIFYLDIRSIEEILELFEPFIRYFVVLYLFTPIYIDLIMSYRASPKKNIENIRLFREFCKKIGKVGNICVNGDYTHIENDPSEFITPFLEVIGTETSNFIETHFGYKLSTDESLMVSPINILPLKDDFIECLNNTFLHQKIKKYGYCLMFDIVRVFPVIIESSYTTKYQDSKTNPTLRKIMFEKTETTIYEHVLPPEKKTTIIRSFIEIRTVDPTSKKDVISYKTTGSNIIEQSIEDKINLDELLVLETPPVLPKNTSTKKTIKIMKNIRVPLRINIEKHVAMGKHVEYDLYALIYHYGDDSKFGHYVTIVKDGGKWFLYNDGTITLVEGVNEKKFLDNESIPHNPVTKLAFYELRE
jgi:hypothetical protein